MPFKRGKKYIAQVRRGEKKREKVFLSKKDAQNWEAEMRQLPNDMWEGMTSTTCLIDWAEVYLDHAKEMFAAKTFDEKK